MVNRETRFSPCRTYRYTLWRHWDMFNEAYVQFLCLNPSTATETVDDPTVRRCIAFAKRWGYGGFCMTNLFAYRSTQPQRLYGVPDPVGPENDATLVQIAAHAGVVVAAWGTHGRYQARGEIVRALLAGHALVCLGVNKDGTPKHPLYLAKHVEPVPYTCP